MSKGGREGGREVWMEMGEGMGREREDGGEEG